MSNDDFDLWVAGQIPAIKMATEMELECCVKASEAAWDYAAESGVVAELSASVAMAADDCIAALTSARTAMNTIPLDETAAAEAYRRAVSTVRKLNDAAERIINARRRAKKAYNKYMWNSLCGRHDGITRISIAADVFGLAAARQARLKDSDNC